MYKMTQNAVILEILQQIFGERDQTLVAKISEISAMTPASMDRCPKKMVNLMQK